MNRLLNKSKQSNALFISIITCITALVFDKTVVKVTSAPSYVSDAVSKSFIKPNIVFRSGSSGWIYSDTVKTGALGGACDKEKKTYSGTYCYE